MLAHSVSLLLTSLIQSANQCKVFSTKFRRLCRDAGMDSVPLNGTSPTISIDGSRVGYEPPEIYITLTLLGALLFLICVCLPPLYRRYFFLPMEALAAEEKLDRENDEEEDEFDRLERREVEKMGNRTSIEDDGNIVRLELATTELLPDDLSVYQTDDGTIFYRKGNLYLHTKFYVKWQGKEIHGDLPDQNLQVGSAHGNTISFYLAEKVGYKNHNGLMPSNTIRSMKFYTAVFTPPDAVKVAFVRDASSDELGNEPEYGLCSRVRYGQRFVYRMCDDPDKDGIRIDVSDSVLRSMRIKCIHRKRAFYVPTNGKHSRTSAFKLSDTVIVVEIPCYATPYAQDSSPFVYFSESNLIYTLDTTTMEFLPHLRIDEYRRCIIAGVHIGTITLCGRNDNTNPWLLTAQLPNAYFETIDHGNKIEEEIQLACSQDEFTSRFATEFKVVKILGVGGFGVVFEASNLMDSWQYAVKRVSVDSKNENKALQEVRAMAKLDHPCIVRYNSTWIERPPEGWQYESDIKMLEIIDSSRDVFLCKCSLSGWLDDNTEESSRPIPRMKMWFKQMVSAVAYIHEMNLIHRDLKPGNILFVGEDKLKLCDLGIVTERRIGDDTEVTRSGIGTALYMSPEQRSMLANYSSKTDVFSLGLVFVELCVVMSSEIRTEVFDNLRAGNQSNRIVDDETAKFVELITQVDPKNRPSCQEILLHSYLA